MYSARHTTTTAAGRGLTSFLRVAVFRCVSLQGTKMVFAGLKSPQERSDLIAYLATNK